MKIQKLIIYPVKSLMGISLSTVQIHKRGLEDDRRWMLIDDKGIFISQRSYPVLSRIQVALNEANLVFTNLNDPENSLKVRAIPLEKGPLIDVKVWRSTCKAIPVSKIADEWFSKFINKACRLVYMPDTSKRLVNQKYASETDIVSFADGYPLLAIGEASLADLNERLDSPVMMDRFRPNIVFSGGAPFDEDDWDQIQINGLSFRGIRPCSRCVMVTVDPSTGVINNAEPLKTLATYRKREKGVYFGMNIIWQHQLHDNSTGQAISVGDKIEVKSRMDEIIFS